MFYNYVNIEIVLYDRLWKVIDDNGNDVSYTVQNGVFIYVFKTKYNCQARQVHNQSLKAKKKKTIFVMIKGEGKN
jgi:hypothetical protein